MGITTYQPYDSVTDLGRHLTARLETTPAPLQKTEELRVAFSGQTLKIVSQGIETFGFDPEITRARFLLEFQDTQHPCDPEVVPDHDDLYWEPIDLFLQRNTLAACFMELHQMGAALPTATTGTKIRRGFEGKKLLTALFPVRERILPLLARAVFPDAKALLITEHDYARDQQTLKLTYATSRLCEREGYTRAPAQHHTTWMDGVCEILMAWEKRVELPRATQKSDHFNLGRSLEI